jgi:hypothetical protein
MQTWHPCPHALFAFCHRLFPFCPMPCRSMPCHAICSMYANANANANANCELVQPASLPASYVDDACCNSGSHDIIFQRLSLELLRCIHQQNPSINQPLFCSCGPISAVFAAGGLFPRSLTPSLFTLSLLFYLLREKVERRQRTCNPEPNERSRENPSRLPLRV